MGTPAAQRTGSAKAYIEGVRKIKGLAESIKEESDIPVFVDRMTSMILFKSGRYYDYVDGYRGIIKGQNILNYGRNIKLRQLITQPTGSSRKNRHGLSYGAMTLSF